MSVKLQRKTLYEELKTRLLRYIEDERPRLLPCERDLIKKYGVSRNTVRRAILELTNEGVLRPVQGLGTLVYPHSELEADSTVLVLTGKLIPPYCQEVFTKLMDCLYLYRINSIMISVDHNNVKNSVARLRRLLSTIKVDGVIFDYNLAFSEPIHNLFTVMRKKCICLRWHPRHFAENYVAEDIECGFYKIANYLLEQGHRKIGLIGSFDGKDTDRSNGVKRAFNKYGVDVDPALIVPLPRPSQFRDPRYTGFQCAEELLSRRLDVSAVICHSDEVALGVMEKLLIAGKKIPEEVAITGFDNLRNSARYPVPLTSCGTDPEALAKAAISILLNNNQPENKEHINFEPELFVRESTIIKSNI